MVDDRKPEALRSDSEPRTYHRSTETDSAFSLQAQNIVVTGAASGIGRQAAIAFAEAGASLVLAGVDNDGLEETAAVIRERGADVLIIATDVTDKAQVDQLATAALDYHGRIDGWANVAGVIVNGLIVDTTPAQLETVLRVNLYGTYWGVAAAGRTIAHGGSVVNVSSAGGDIPAPELSVYAMSKAAVNHLTRCAAVEFGPSGLRVNAVAPGFTETPMVQRHWTAADGSVEEEQRQELLSRQRQLSPLGLTGTPEDQALAMRYLMSDAARFTTGQILRPNGGVFMA